MSPFRQLGSHQTVEAGFFIWHGNQGLRKVIHIEALPAENAEGGDEGEEFRRKGEFIEWVGAQPERRGES
jgi:hypothetical protein